jgi:hypothetical protein
MSSQERHRPIIELVDNKSPAEVSATIHRVSLLERKNTITCRIECALNWVNVKRDAFATDNIDS